MMMQPGHERCPKEVEQVDSLQGPFWVVTECHHTHESEVQAIDGTGTGPIVADHCLCCGRFRFRDDYR